MNNKFLIALSLLLATSATCPSYPSSATSSSETYESSCIANIDVILENAPPNTSFDPKTVLTRLKTKVGDPFSQIIFDLDLKALSNDYDRVEPFIELHNGEVYLQIKLWPRPAIRTIKWEGNTHVKTKTLQKELGIKPHSTFNRQAFTKAFNKIKEYYVKKGYFESELSYVVTPDPKTNEVDIDIRVREGRSGVIDKIIFKGFTSQEQSALLEMIYTKKYNFFTSWFLGTGVYNEEALEQDKLTIVNFLQNEGYADAKVNFQILDSKKQGKIIIEITADRGPVFHFGQVTFSGNTLFTDEQVESRFLIYPQATYSPEKLRQTAQSIKDMYGRKGYIETNVQYEVKLIEDEPVYNAHFQIEEGEQYKIGLIRVFGNVQTNANVILHESLLIPGETFDTAKLKATQQRLENIGYFKSVNVYAVRTQDDKLLGENYRDVYIEVEETTTGNVSLFGGFSTTESIFGGIDIAENNFNYRGIPKIFKEGISAIRGGGEYAHIRFSLGPKQSSYAISWLTPYFRDTLWRVGFNADYTHSTVISEDYDINTLGFTTYASYPLNLYWTFGWKYRIRNAMIHISHDTSRSERRQAGSEGLISASSVSLGFDSTDSALKPHRGFRSLLEGEYAGIGGDFTFLRFGYLNTYYTPLWKKGTMKYRFDFKFILPIWKSSSPDDIPLSERFFLGGETTVRGYRAFDLGAHFDNGDPKGGISSTLLSVEYLQEIFSCLDAFVFADAGSIGLKRFYFGGFKLSYGFGIRLEMINRIPIIMGMGFPVNPDGRSEVRKFFFSMGGQF